MCKKKSLVFPCRTANQNIPDDLLEKIAKELTRGSYFRVGFLLGFKKPILAKEQCDAENNISKAGFSILLKWRNSVPEKTKHDLSEVLRKARLPRIAEKYNLHAKLPDQT